MGLHGTATAGCPVPGSGQTILSRYAKLQKYQTNRPVSPAA
jgi:hypothetical protein